MHAVYFPAYGATLAMPFDGRFVAAIYPDAPTVARYRGATRRGVIRPRRPAPAPVLGTPYRPQLEGRAPGTRPRSGAWRPPSRWRTEPAQTMTIAERRVFEAQYRATVAAFGEDATAELWLTGAMSAGKTVARVTYRRAIVTMYREDRRQAGLGCRSSAEAAPLDGSAPPTLSVPCIDGTSIDVPRVVASMPPLMADIVRAFARGAANQSEVATMIANPTYGGHVASQATVSRHWNAALSAIRAILP